jgi:hypothetical protein
MTHSLHRKGNVNDLEEDYVLLAMVARGINDKYDDSRQKLIKIAEIMSKYKPTNIMPKFGWQTSSTITAAFDNIESVKDVIYQLKKEDLGISIVVSGLISEIKNVLLDLNLNIHTVHFSLGTFGRMEKLPSNKILEITSMCGHHTVSPQSISHYLDLIQKGKLTIEKAAKKLAKPCVCGIFNTTRAVELLTSLVNK